ncbi:MAG: hypothetical protein BJ554DRAFT_5920 [Olpidium bornovanus]|uniref:Uncharacterized protein n=1 Tax=Olpidium bornovanus TaxID=278681 RepID=A0A8H7ZYS6_9FUNG|nr:MAG: hypothetical protein BJ554DRAFT_5920 [Olpidium bornovanus]
MQSVLEAAEDVPLHLAAAAADPGAAGGQGSAGLISSLPADVTPRRRRADSADHALHARFRSGRISISAASGGRRRADSADQVLHPGAVSLLEWTRFKRTSNSPGLGSSKAAAVGQRAAGSPPPSSASMSTSRDFFVPSWAAVPTEVPSHLPAFRRSRLSSLGSGVSGTAAPPMRATAQVAEEDPAHRKLLSARRALELFLELESTRPLNALAAQALAMSALPRPSSPLDRSTLRRSTGTAPPDDTFVAGVMNASADDFSTGIASALQCSSELRSRTDADRASVLPSGSGHAESDSRRKSKRWARFRWMSFLCPCVCSERPA